VLYRREEKDLEKEKDIAKLLILSELKDVEQTALKCY
jgi:hypothetical protein